MSAATLAKPAEAQTVSGTVSLEACTQPAQTVTFSFSSATKSYFFTRTVTLGADKSYSLPDIPADVYHVKVKGAKWLAAVTDVDTTQGNASLSPSLLTGDANNDNSVDSTDFGLVLSALGGNVSVPASGYDPACDFDCDGLVNSTDFALLIGDYGAGGDELPAGTALPLSLVTDSVPSACLLYPDVVNDVNAELMGTAAFGYVSLLPETVRFEDDFTPNAMQTHLVLATRNSVHVCIYEAPSIVAPATVLTAPGTVMYDATFAPAPSGPSPDPYNGIANALHTVDITLTAGTTYHIAIDFDDTASFETMPDYAASYGFTSVGIGGFDGVILFPVCAAPPTVVSCFWNVYTPIESIGFYSAYALKAKPLKIWKPDTPGAPAYPTMTVQPGLEMTFNADTATDDDLEIVDYSDGTSVPLIVPDTITYSWLVDGVLQSAAGTILTWTAPMVEGHHIVTLIIDDGNDTNLGACSSTRDDPALIFNFDVWVCTHAHPDGVQQMSSENDGMGMLIVHNGMSSSDNSLTDIQGCMIREEVSSPGQGNPINTTLPDPPFDTATWQEPNPFIRPVTQILGLFDDYFMRGKIVGPLKAASYHSTQYYSYHCPDCMTPTQWQRFAGPFDIFREVYFDTNTMKWMYRVTRNGASATWEIQL